MYIKIQSLLTENTVRLHYKASLICKLHTHKFKLCITLCQPHMTEAFRFFRDTIIMSLMKQQYVVTHRYTFLQETEKKTSQSRNRPTFKHVMFLRKCKETAMLLDTAF